MPTSQPLDALPMLKLGQGLKGAFIRMLTLYLVVREFAGVFGRESHDGCEIHAANIDNNRGIFTPAE